MCLLYLIGLSSNPLYERISKKVCCSPGSVISPAKKRGAGLQPFRRGLKAHDIFNVKHHVPMAQSYSSILTGRRASTEISRCSNSRATGPQPPERQPRGKKWGGGTGGNGLRDLTRKAGGHDQIPLPVGKRRKLPIKQLQRRLGRWGRPLPHNHNRRGQGRCDGDGCTVPGTVDSLHR